MEVIFRGQIPNPNFKGTCYNCKSIVEAEPKELSVYSDQREGTSGSGICPVCGRHMNFYPINK